MTQTPLILSLAAALLLMPVVSGFSRTLQIASTQSRAEMQRVPQFENDRATSWKTIIPPHAQSTLHRHDRYRALIALTGGDLTNVSADGQVTVTHLEKGKAYWNEPMPAGAMHKDVNDTDQTIEVVVVEMK